jgi:hypothetical protein
MKKFIFYAFVCLILLIVFGCDKHQGALGFTNKVNIEGLKESHRVINIDGCQYIVYDAGSGHNSNGFMAHKGNCNNEIHICPK